VKGTELQNKVALVTGSRRGIGRAVALALSGAGADVVACDIVLDDGKLDETAEAIKALGRRSAAFKVDISDRAQVESMVEQSIRMFGRIDILVNCAGVWIPGGTLVDCSEEDWDRVIDTNLKGTYLCCRSVGRIMVKQREGNIINLSSQVGLNPGAGVGAYSISKAGIIMLTRQLALELAPYNIRVNALAPGIVKTDFNADLWKDSESASRLSRAIPIGRMADPDDVARPVVFLASDDSRYMTGTIINVDGGWQVPVSDRPDLRA
jgi:3-oxoacyl-[acyl-carrier protein] reductase